MESLTYGGIETVLFVRPPSQELLAQYSHVRAMGIAGSSRAMSVDEMAAELPMVFSTLLGHHPSIVHYKTCSTFDSSPTIGSVGKAIEIGRQVFRNKLTPLVIGAPALQRFCIFANLFARSGLDSVPYRLDRHPTMSFHPVTPMDESDLRLHLARQTELPIRLIDVLELDTPEFDWRESIGGHDGVVLFDTLRHEHLLTIGRSISDMQRQAGKPLFVAGSSGVDYALVEYWQQDGSITKDFEWTGCGEPLGQTLVVSGSCSPVTDRQIQWAKNNDFAEVPLDSPLLTESTARSCEIERAVGIATRELRDGRSVIVHTCRGPSDPRIEGTQASAKQLSETLALVLRATLQQYPLQRVAVTGGDTSGHVARRLVIEALEMVGPMAPGSPLCVARSKDKVIDGIEITFKGGQVGHDDFFATVLRGKPNQRLG